MELIKIWEIIWRRKWIIIQAFVIISLTALFSSFLMTPVYEASAKVLIETSEATSSFLSSMGLKNLMPLPRGKESSIETPMALATAKPVLDKVITRLQLRDRKGRLMKPDALLKSKFIISRIFPKPYVEIVQVEDTNLFELKATSVDPEQVSMIANTLAEAYIEENLIQRKEEYRSAREFIQDQIGSVKAGYLKASEEIRIFKTTEKTVDLERETGRAIDRMADLMKGKEDTAINLSEVMARMETLKTQLRRGNEDIVSSSAISENPQIEALKRKLSDLALELAGVLTEKTPDHPDVVALNQKIRTGRAELRKEMDVFQELSSDLQSLERDLAALEAHLKGINTDIDKQMSILYAIPGKAFSESELQLNYRVSQGLYGSLLESLYQIGLAEAMTLSDIRLVEPAVAPDIDKPKSPNKVLNGIMGMFLGLMFGFGLGFLVDYLDDTIKIPEEIKALDLPFLGIIPLIKRKEGYLIFGKDPKCPLSESYRTVRNSIKFVSLDKPIKTLLITSPLPNEGKTTTAINLAISMVREGKQVLLMDTDFPNSKMSKIFGMSDSIGIANILAEGVTIAEAVQNTDVEGLSILASGPSPPDPGQMIESRKMGQLIRDVTVQYDSIILDSPPMLLVNDAAVLAGHVDALILILESGKTTARALSQVGDFLAQANIQLSGIVLNKFKIGRGGYYYKSGYYSGGKK